MDNQKELLKESFKSAIASTVKSIAAEPDLKISFDEKNINDEKTIILPEIKELSNSNEYLELRAIADSEALKIRYTDKSIYSKNEPVGKIEKELYKTAEKIRYEKIGSNYFEGIKKNLNNYFQNKLKKSELSESKNLDTEIVETFELYLRNIIFEEKNDHQANKLNSEFKKKFSKEVNNEMIKLKNLINDQNKFSKAISQLINNLNLQQNNEEEKNESKENKNEEELKNNENEETKSDVVEQKDDDDLNTELGLSELSDKSDVNNEDLNEGKELEFSPENNKRFDNKLGNKLYKIFSREFDEVSKAETLETEDELLRLRKNLDQQLMNLKNVISQLANKLQRKLLAKQNRSWEFDLEEGLLDSAKLSRVIIDPTSHLSYKIEKDIEFKDTVVTLLIDNSGSMRGRPITVAAICADILSRTLERCSVKVEILGFTTKNWKGGQSREQWIARGKKNNPGRLNDLRHIIYKPADMPWRQTKNNLGLMLKEGILKENIDGEAIIWASKRLMKRKEERKILMIISDGAPVDDSTLSVNSGDYLEKHLKETVKYVENNTPIDVTAIGIGHDVTRYYKKAIKINDVQELGDVMINQITNLFSEDNNKLN